MPDHSIHRNDFYVYALFREDGNTPFYIGKGRGNRIFVHEKEAHKNTSHKDRIIQAMHANGILKVPKLKLIEGVTDSEAKVIESDLIKLIGRWPVGPLTNLTSGGDGVSNLSPESLAKKRAANVSSWANPEVRKKRCSAMKAVWTPEKKAEHISKAKERTSSPEWRTKMSAIARASHQREDVKEKVRRAAASEETRAKRSASMKAVFKNQEKRDKYSEARKKFQSIHEYKEKRREISKRIWKDLKIREKIITSRKSYFKENPRSPELIEKSVNALNSPQSLEKRRLTNLLPEVRNRRISAQKAAFSTPEAKAKRSAASKAVWEKKKLVNVPSE